MDMCRFYPKAFIFLISHKAPLAANRPFSLSKDRCIEAGF